jgi:hypothetical protein
MPRPLAGRSSSGLTAFQREQSTLIEASDVPLCTLSMQPEIMNLSLYIRALSEVSRNGEDSSPKLGAAHLLI